MVEKIISKIKFKDYILIAIGALIMAAGIALLVDAKVVPGGASGLSMAIYYLSGGSLPVGITIWFINVPLFIWGYIELGKRFGIKTFYGFTLVSLFIDILRGDMIGLKHIRIQDLPAVKDLYQNDFLFLVLIGSVLLGIGLGIIFKFRGTTAGSDIVAAIMQKRLGWKPGQAIMFIDFFVISIAGLIIHYMDLSPDKPALSLTLYAFFLLFVSSKLIDVVIDGFDYARAAFIISDKNEEIGNAIIKDLSRGATAVKTRGIYRNIDREMIYTVVTLKELGNLIDLVKSIDPTAFIIINNVHEVLGAGFRRRI